MKSYYLIATIVRLAIQVIFKNIILYNSKILITLAGNHQLLKEQILSIPEHISNTHHFPSNTQHTACRHQPITRAWLKKDSLVL